MLPVYDGFYSLTKDKLTELVKVRVGKYTNSSFVYFIGDARRYKLKDFSDATWIGPIVKP